MRSVSIEDQTGALNAASLTDLRERWQKQYGSLPSKHISRKLLIRALAFEAQVKAHGGLKASTRKRLTAIAMGEDPQPAKKKAQAGRPEPGTRLLREWHGKTCIVEVSGSGFVWEGEDYSSLSAVAHAITGAKWNGRRFFGLPGVPRVGTARRKAAAK